MPRADYGFLGFAMFPLSKKECGCIKTAKLFLGILFFVASPAFCNEWEEIDPEKDIVNTLSDDRSAGWMITGQLDLDGDGDLDTLVAHEYLMEGYTKDIDFADFLVYFKEGEKFLFARKVGLIRAYFNNVEFRDLKGTSGNNALIKYDTAAGVYDRVFAAWYGKDSSGEIFPGVNYLPASAVGDADEDDIVSTEHQKEWAKRGLPLDKVLKNYRRMELEEARRFYGVTSPEELKVPESEKVGKEGEKASHDQEGDSVKDEADKNILSIVAVLVVLASLGFVAAFAFYRRRRG